MQAWTNGTAPSGGIDIEPDRASQDLVNIVLRNVTLLGNHGGGLLINLGHSNESTKVSISAEGLLIDGDMTDGVGIGVGNVWDPPAGALGTISIRDTVVRNTRGCGASIYRKSSRGARLSFSNTTFSQVALGGTGTGRSGPGFGCAPTGACAPILLINGAPYKPKAFSTDVGGVRFVRGCSIHDSIEDSKHGKKVPRAVVVGLNEAGMVTDIQAEFDVVRGLGSPCGATEQLVSMQSNRSRVDITMRCHNDAVALPEPQTRCTSLPIDAMHKLIPGATDMPTPLSRPVAAARGELVHLQVAIINGTVGVGGTARATIEGISEVTVRVLAYTDMTPPTSVENAIASVSRPGLYPDPLVPLGGATADQVGPEHVPVTADDGKSAPQVFWISANVPPLARPGLHKGAFLASDCATATFTLQVSAFTLPNESTQLTGAQFQARDIQAFSPDQVFTPETALMWFESFAAQHSNSHVWFQLDDLPWAPSYVFTADESSVVLNTTANDKWWPKVLHVTGSKNWRMPFSARIHRVLPHRFTTNTTWTFNMHSGPRPVPIFAGGAGLLNPEFSRHFRVLFSAVMKYLDSKGWGSNGSWVQLLDEPDWTDPTTLANSIAVMKLYKSIDRRIKVYQTRWPAPASANGEAGVALQPQPSILPNAKPLLELVDWWCFTACQLTVPGVPETLSALRANRTARDKQPPFHVTIYDNGVPVIEAPWERLRFQPLNVWSSNGVLDGTLSWYSVNSYRTKGNHKSASAVLDPYLHPYPNPTRLSNGSAYLQFPAGWGYLLYPPPPGLRTKTSWAPVESVRWIMTGAGIQDTEYLYALQKRKWHSTTAKALLAQARTLATHFPIAWDPVGCGYKSRSASWGNDGYSVDSGRELDGSSIVNEWRLAMGAELSQRDNPPGARHAADPEYLRLLPQL